MASANDVGYGGNGYGVERTRYLVEIMKLTTATVKVKIIHNMMKNMFDLKPYTTPVTFRIARDTYDSVLMHFMTGKPAIVEVVNGKVLNAVATDEAEMRPIQKVALQTEAASNYYGTIYTSLEKVDKVVSRIKSMSFHWTHEAHGEQHIITLGDSIEVETDHCGYCASIKLRKTAYCAKCAKLGINALYDISYELLGMVKVTAENINTGGVFSVRADHGGQKLSIQCKGFVINTSVDELQSILEKMTANVPDENAWRNTVSQ
jgi:hypothetical protein